MGGQNILIQAAPLVLILLIQQNFRIFHFHSPIPAEAVKITYGLQSPKRLIFAGMACDAAGNLHRILSPALLWIKLPDHALLDADLYTPVSQRLSMPDLVAHMPVQIVLVQMNRHGQKLHLLPGNTVKIDPKPKLRIFPDRLKRGVPVISGNPSVCVRLMMPVKFSPPDLHLIRIISHRIVRVRTGFSQIKRNIGRPWRSQLPKGNSLAVQTVLHISGISRIGKTDPASEFVSLRGPEERAGRAEMLPSVTFVMRFFRDKIIPPLIVRLSSQSRERHIQLIVLNGIIDRNHSVLLCIRIARISFVRTRIELVLPLIPVFFQHIFQLLEFGLRNPHIQRGSSLLKYSLEMPLRALLADTDIPSLHGTAGQICLKSLYIRANGNPFPVPLFYILEFFSSLIHSRFKADLGARFIMIGQIRAAGNSMSVQ